MDYLFCCRDLDDYHLLLLLLLGSNHFSLKKFFAFLDRIKYVLAELTLETNSREMRTSKLYASKLKTTSPLMSLCVHNELI